jgi:hypothetical protein
MSEEITYPKDVELKSASKILTTRRFDAECGKMSVTLFNPQAKPILISVDNTSQSTIIHLSIANAEQLRDALIDVITNANFNEANKC